MAIQRVRPMKVEALAEGGGQADMDLNEVNIGEDFIDACGYTLQAAGATTPTSDALVYLNRTTGGALTFTDIPSGTLTLEQLLTSAAGKPGSHNAVADIIHFLSEGPGDGYVSGAYRQVISTGSLPVSITWFTSSAAAARIYSVAFTYTGLLISTKTQTLYVNNVAVRTLVDTFTYTANVFAPTITRTWS